MDHRNLERWAIGLRRAGNSSDGPLPRVSQGNRTNTLPFLLRRGVLDASSIERPANPDPDALLWWALLDRRISEAQRTLEQNARSDERNAQDAGSVFPRGLYSAIEVWTESELSALTALWWLSRLEGAESLAGRMRDAALWHLEHTQPDNATNRPWGIPVFLELARKEGSADALLFAETLLHNAMAANGVPEPLSAQILLDAADAVDLMIREE